MPKVSVMTEDKAPAVGAVRGCAGEGRAQAYFAGEQHPLHLHKHRLAPGERLSVGPLETDCVAYVWKGAVEAGGWAMANGSSLIVEHGETLEIVGGDGASEVLTFTAAHPAAKTRAGGHVHLLPDERVPQYDEVHGPRTLKGRMHANAACPTCEVWLHENHMSGGPAPATREEQERGIHSHTEDEIIFILDGEMRLGAKLFGPGTAVAIAADTLYSFTVGPDGLSFVNFRSGTPTDIRFPNGPAISETEYWKERLPGGPEYVAPR